MKNKIEAKIVRFFWHDGLLDILAGLGILLIGLAWQFDLVPLGAIAPAILIPFWKPLRSRITEPRLGFVELSQTQQRRNNRFLWFVCGLGCATMVAGIAVYFMVAGSDPGKFKVIVPALPAIIIAGASLLTALITASSRFVSYAMILMICGIAVSILGWEPGCALIAGGSAMAAGGIITLFSFCQRYPRHPLSQTELHGDV